VDVHPPDESSYRDFALFFQDEDALIGTQIMPYSDRVEGVVGLNYTSEPLAKRLAQDPDPATVFVCSIRGDPATPVLHTFVGDNVRIHVFAPFSEQNQVFAVEAHRWQLEPDIPGSDTVGAVQFGGSEVVDIRIASGAGGLSQAPGDYLYGDHRGPYIEAGLWGVLRVHATHDQQAEIRALPDGSVRD
jgi:hypothetical protein